MPPAEADHDKAVDPSGMSVLAEARPSAARRGLALVVLVALGAMLLWLGLTLPDGGALTRVGLILGGLLVLIGAEAMRRATGCPLVLTETALMELDRDGKPGRVVAPLDQIAAVERGTFAMKPSNGFLLRLRTPASRVWAPGLWWRMGRRIGVGGVVSAPQAKAMAQIIEFRLAGGDPRG
jgi:hypothetical protein